MNRLQPGSRGALITYVTTAVLLRCLDAGATVGIVLVALASPQVENPVRLGALVGAALTLPHMLGPWVARLTSLVPIQRLVIPLAGLWFAGLLTTITLGVGRLPIGALLGLAAAAGVVGPILTGGLSSHVTGALGARRASVSWDALTYGIAGTVAPALVATSAVVVGPVPGVLGLAGLGAVGGVVASAIPATTDRDARRSHASLRGAATVLLRDPRLRPVVVLTWVGAFITAAALIIGITELAATAPAVSGHVATALGVGGLLGAAALIWRAPTADPRRGLLITTLMIAGCCALAAATTAAATLLVLVFLLLGLVNAAQAVFSLVAREELSPPHLRREIFISLAGTKVAFSSAGTASAGLLTALGGQTLLLGLTILGLATCAVLVLTRRRGHARPDDHALPET